MKFKIEKEEYINKTFRISKKLAERMEKVCENKNISMNKLVVMCIEYAFENMEDSKI